jgi:uncharacterized protein (UPF0248 family)
VRDVHFAPGDRQIFQVIDAGGEPISIPLHRIREVYRDGELIWSRGEGP